MKAEEKRIPDRHMVSNQGKNPTFSPVSSWIHDSSMSSLCKWRCEVLFGHFFGWGFLWLLYFPLQKVKAECVQPISHLRRLEGQQSQPAYMPGSPFQWPQLQTRTSWGLGMAKAEEGEGSRQELLQAVEGSFHWWSVAEGRVRELSPFLSAQCRELAALWLC